MNTKEAITELIYKNSLDTGDGVLIDYKEIHNVIDKLESLFSLKGVSSSLKVYKLHVGINSINLKDGDGNEYVLDKGKVYKKVVIEKYVLVDEKL